MKVLYRSKSLQDVVNPTYSGLSPTKLLQINSIESSERKTRIYFLKGTKVQGNNKCKSEMWT